MSAKIPIWFDTVHALHAGPVTHPECPRRILETLNELKDKSEHFIFYPKSDFVFPRTRESIRKAREWKYIDGDTYETQYTQQLVERGNEMIQEAIDSKSPIGFILIRPPGHHAGIKGPSGFCFSNNIWNACTYALKSGYKKISILDWDAHHGDGTEELVLASGKSDSIRFASLHAFGHGIFPGTGALSNKSSGILNIPLARYTNSEDYLKIFYEQVMPFLDKPDILLVSAGYDAHKDDPMQLLSLTENTYKEMSGALKSIGCRVLFVLEGGYNPEILGKCVYATLEPWF
jgi:acetoin utilization deacetylase AcuC-like enzyme